MEKIKLAVIFGGKSSEYSVSLHSAESLLQNCDPQRYDLTLIGITKEGKWLHYPSRDFEAIAHDHWHENPLCREVMLSPSAKVGFVELDEDGTYKKLPVDVIFPCLHGKNGEDGTIQGLFELSEIPYVGCSHISSALIMDKEFTHIICERAGVKCADYIAVYQSRDTDMEELYERAKKQLGLPIFIKPANAGSSYGISKVSDFDSFVAGLNEAFQHDWKVLLETTIPGFEIGCAIMGNDRLIVGECDEIDTHKDFFDFAAKYDLEDTQIYCPARISQAVSDHAKEIAKTVYEALNCTGMCRVDMFVNGEDIIFNEANTIPGFTATSRYPSMMKAIGLDFKTVIDSLVDLALNK